MSDKTQALLAVINSIAAEQEAIARLINSETAKLKIAIEDLINGEIAPRAEELLLMQDILKSITGLIEGTTKLEEKLTEKMDIATNHLPPDPPCPECPPCPKPPFPKLPCPECPECVECPECAECPPCPSHPKSPRPPKQPCSSPRPTPPCPPQRRTHSCFSSGFLSSLCACLYRRPSNERCNCNKCRSMEY